MAAHTPLRVMDSKAECIEAAQSGAKADASKWILKLADVEAPTEVPFRLFMNPKNVPKQPSLTNFEGSIPVPMNWQMVERLNLPPVYTNEMYPWARRGVFPFNLVSYSVPNKKNATGVYEFTMDLPEEWLAAINQKQRGLFVIIHGAASAVKVYVGDQYVGYAQDSMTESEFDITGFINRGENTKIYMIVYQICDGSYLEDQDHWWLSGIFRDVELQCRPLVGIRDFGVEAIVERERSARVDVCVDHLVKAYDPSMKYQLSATLVDAEGQEVASRAMELDGLSQTVNLLLDVENPHMWSAATPYLYTVIISLFDVDMKEHHVEYAKIGIRSIDFIDGQLCVNREPLLVCGVNRHEHDMLAGKVMTEAVMLQDIQILKQNNFNAVRCCHYPNAHRWYELCDEYGIYLVDEANMENHGFQLLMNMSLPQVDSRWKSQIIARIKSMWYRSRNHPSIIIYSLGNESGAGPNTRAAAKWLRSVERSRPIQYESANADGEPPVLYGSGRDPYLTDIVCPMYHQPLEIARTVRKKSEGRPLILCEYAHAMGNSGGGLHIYFDLFRSSKHPQLQGGFVWDFVDQGLQLPWMNDGQVGYGRDFVKKGNSKFCINGILFPDRSPHPVVAELKYLQQNFSVEYKAAEKDGRIFLTIKKIGETDVDMTELDVRCYILSEVTPFNAETSTPVLETNVATTHEPEVVLGLDLPWNPSYDEGSWLRAELLLNVDKPWAQAGHVVAHETFEMEPIVWRRVMESVPGQDTGFESTIEDGMAKINTKKYSAAVDMKSGDLVALFSSQGISLMDSPISHSFYRAATDNDEGGISFPSMVLNEFRSYKDQWRRMGLHKLSDKLKSCEVLFDDRVRTLIEAVRVHKSGPFKIFTTTTRYTFTRDAVDVDVTVKASIHVRSIRSLPRVGLTFQIPTKMSKVEWCGRGPHECYPDRKRSAQVGVYESTVDAMHVPYVVPSENGGRADVQWCKLSDPESGEGIKLSYKTDDKSPREEVKEGFPKQMTQGKTCPRPAGTTGAQLSVSRYSVEELEQAKHQYELTPSEKIHVHLDTAFMGIGGDSSWLPQTHKQYRVSGSKWTYNVKIEPLIQPEEQA